jgi:hypothetical protein
VEAMRLLEVELQVWDRRWHAGVVGVSTVSRLTSVLRHNILNNYSTHSWPLASSHHKKALIKEAAASRVGRRTSIHQFAGRLPHRRISKCSQKTASFNV